MLELVHHRHPSNEIGSKVVREPFRNLEQSGVVLSAANLMLPTPSSSWSILGTHILPFSIHGFRFASRGWQVLRAISRCCFPPRVNNTVL